MSDSQAKITALIRDLQPWVDNRVAAMRRSRKRWLDAAVAGLPPDFNGTAEEAREALGQMRRDLSAALAKLERVKALAVDARAKVVELERTMYANEQEAWTLGWFADRLEAALMDEP